MQSSFLGRLAIVMMAGFLVGAFLRPAQAMPTFGGGGRANCQGCHASPREAATGPSMVSANPGDSVALSIDVTDAPDKYSISLAGLGAAGLEGFTPDATWVDHFSPGKFNADPQYGGPFFALSDTGLDWTPPGPVTHTFNLALAPTTVPGTYDLTFTVGGSTEEEGQWGDPNPFQLIVTAAAAPGDFDQDGDVDIADVNALIGAIAGGGNPPAFDVTNDGQVDRTDLNTWVDSLFNSPKGTWIGDSNLDGEFNTGDLVQIFQRGKFEQDADAGWDDGDWTADQRFNTGDLVAAFQAGGFEKGPKAAAAAVPEPSSILLTLLFGLVGLHVVRSRRG